MFSLIQNPKVNRSRHFKSKETKKTGVHNEKFNLTLYSGTVTSLSLAFLYEFMAVTKIVKVLALYLMTLHIAHAALTPSTNLRELCQQSPNDCLIQTQEAIEIVAERSFEWYELTLFKIEALHLLERFDELLLLLDKLKELKGVPIYFKTKVYYYLAKVSPPSPLKAQYLETASNLLDMVNDSFFDPMLLLDIYILKLEEKSRDKIQNTYNNLKALDEKYARNTNPLFKKELYAVLGHYAKQLNYLVEQKAYREKSLHWSFKFGNKQQIGVAHYNLAITCVALKQHKLAITHFQQSMSFAKESNDFVGVRLAAQKLEELAKLQNTN